MDFPKLNFLYQNGVGQISHFENRGLHECKLQFHFNLNETGDWLILHQMRPKLLGISHTFHSEVLATPSTFQSGTILSHYFLKFINFICEYILIIYVKPWGLGKTSIAPSTIDRQS